MQRVCWAIIESMDMQVCPPKQLDYYRASGNLHATPCLLPEPEGRGPCYFTRFQILDMDGHETMKKYIFCNSERPKTSRQGEKRASVLSVLKKMSFSHVFAIAKLLIHSPK